MGAMKFNVGLAQIAPRLGDVPANLQKHLDLITDARRQQVDLLIFPELGLTGYYLKDLVADVALRPSADDPIFAPLLAASRDLDLVVGFAEVDARYRYFISAAYLAAGRVVHVHRKIYLPTYRIFDDARFFGAGDQLRAFDTRFGRMSILVCEDLWHISSPYTVWLDGADFILGISSSPGYGVTAPELAIATEVNNFLQTYASLLTTFVFYVNRVGLEDGIQFWGGSIAYAPGATVLARAPLFDEALVVAECDPDTLARARYHLPTLRDERVDIVRRELERIQDRTYRDAVHREQGAE
jgi:predicted amidohydrolase